MIAHAIARNWWVVLIRGIAAILFALCAFIFPMSTWLAVGILFGAYAFVDGVFAIASAVRAAQAHERWWPFVIEGIVGLLIAGITFYDVQITIIALYYVIAFWAFVTGIIEIVAAFQLRKAIANELMLILGGLISILFGVLLIARPAVGGAAVAYLFGFYALFFGITMIGLAMRLRGHLHATHPAA